jgi:hypothetical protein
MTQDVATKLEPARLIKTLSFVAGRFTMRHQENFDRQIERSTH